LNVAWDRIISLAGGFAVGWFSHVLAASRDRKNPAWQAKNALGVIIRAKTADIPQRHVRDFYVSTKPQIKSAVDGLLHFLPASKSKGLEILWKEYDQDANLQFDEYEDKIGLSAVQGLHKAAHAPPYEGNASKIRKYLDRFYDFAK
jgi:hypothetical protein